MKQITYVNNTWPAKLLGFGHVMVTNQQSRDQMQMHCKPAHQFKSTRHATQAYTLLHYVEAMLLLDCLKAVYSVKPFFMA